MPVALDPVPVALVPVESEEVEAPHPASRMATTNPLARVWRHDDGPAEYTAVSESFNPRRRSAKSGLARQRSSVGPASGAGFSDGPDRGATIARVGYGHTLWAGTHTVTLVGKSNPVAIATGVAGWPLVKVTFITRPP